MKYQINLLRQKEKSFTDKVIYFSLHYLRYILVLTQIVVIGVFFYRFKIDQEIIDLRDELQQKEEIVLVSEPLLLEAKSVDIKTREAVDILTKQDMSQKMTNYFLSIFPRKMSTRKLEVREGVIEFEGVTNDPQTIKAFFERLKKDKQFKVIELGSIRKMAGEYYCPFILRDFVDTNGQG